jgi:hypothetical protein
VFVGFRYRSTQPTNFGLLFTKLSIVAHKMKNIEDVQVARDLGWAGAPFSYFLVANEESVIVRSILLLFQK